MSISTGPLTIGRGVNWIKRLEIAEDAAKGWLARSNMLPLEPAFVLLVNKLILVLEIL